MGTIDSTLEELMGVNGALGCAVVDAGSGMALGTSGSGVDLELAAAGNSDVINAKMRTMKSLGLTGGIEDILITLDTQLHVIRPSSSNEGLFIYLVLDKRSANLALARRKVSDLESELARI